MKDNTMGETPKYHFEKCARKLNNVTVHGETCETDSDNLYHHTDIDNLPSIRSCSCLRPGEPPSDGTVNFSANPNLHRFGSLRFVVDKKKISTVPMCYVQGDEYRKLTSAVSERMEEEQKRGQPTSSNWVENREFGAESFTAYKDECKHFSREPVSLKGTVKKLEYWIPWSPTRLGKKNVGTNVFPCHADWTAWTTGKPSEENIEKVKKEIEEAKSFAKELNVPFDVRTCYPFIKLDDHRIAKLNEENLERLKRGEELLTETSYHTPESTCTCPEESIKAWAEEF